MTATTATGLQAVDPRRSAKTIFSTHTSVPCSQAQNVLHRSLPLLSPAPNAKCVPRFYLLSKYNRKRRPGMHIANLSNKFEKTLFEGSFCFFFFFLLDCVTLRKYFQRKLEFTKLLNLVHNSSI